MILIGALYHFDDKNAPLLDMIYITLICHIFISDVQAAKPTAIRRVAVRETGTSQHRGCKIQGRSDYHSTIVLSDLRGPLKWAPIMTRDAILADSR